ncbi:MAG: tetratricopeptide repeat protein [Magnetococcus sp. DMHC-8]
MVEESTATRPVSVLVAEARESLARGDWDQAWTLCEALLRVDPDNPEMLHWTSLICARRGELDAAIERIDHALRGLPDHPDLLKNLGVLWKRKGNLHQALEQFQRLDRVQPDQVETLCQLGELHLQLRNTVEAATELQKAIKLDPACGMAHTLLAQALYRVVNLGTVYPRGMLYRVGYHQRLASYHAGRRLDLQAPPVADTFYADRDRAWQAVQQGTHFCCYHPGIPFPEAPPNLIAVPDEQRRAEAFFATSRQRLPEDVNFDPGTAAEQASADWLIAVLDNAQQVRLQEAYRLAPVCRSIRPVFVPGQPLRVFVPATRHRPGFWSLANGYARGFAKAGCEVQFFSEERWAETDDWEVLGFSRWQQALIDFNPHVVLDINANFDWHSAGLLQVHPEVFKVLWFQDLVPLISAGTPVAWRPRDLIYSLAEEFDQLLYRSGARTVRRNGFCYDDQVFHDQGRERKYKAVLAGGGFGHVPGAFPNCGKLLAILEELFEAGQPLTEAELDRLADRFPFSKPDIYMHMWAYVVRNVSARWLCELSGELGMEVEIYGYKWEPNAAVQPFFKGRLPFGSPELATVYNEARYALVPHPFDLQSLRLAEVTACGALPVVYDCRYRAIQPHWDDYCLWYRTKEEMRTCLLQQRPPQSPLNVCRGRTYTDFAKRVLADIEADVSSGARDA